MKVLMDEIRDYMLAKYDFFDKGYSNVRKPSGSEIVMDEDGQRYEGITDVDGNFFYIRNTGKSTLTPITRGARIPAYKETARCRLVMLHKSADKQSLVNVGMVSIAQNGGFVSATDDDTSRVFREETGKNLLTRDNNLTIVAIDFDLIGIVSSKKCTLDPCNC